MDELVCSVLSLQDLSRGLAATSSSWWPLLEGSKLNNGARVSDLICAGSAKTCKSIALTLPLWALLRFLSGCELVLLSLTGLVAPN